METVFENLTDKDKERLIYRLEVSISSFSKSKNKDFKRFHLSNGTSVLVKLEPHMGNREHLSVLITNPKSKQVIKEDFYFFLVTVGRAWVLENKAKEMIKVISYLMY